ncbi:MAG: hypothetical protein J0H96_11990 [Microbacterium ginsengisoli]|nr:hypothetical protein [Microbacterium ginsengisoli]
MVDSTGRRLDNFEVAPTDMVLGDARPVRGRFVASGDSITEVDSARASNSWGNSWATFAALASGGRLTHIYACAKGGANTTTTRGLFESEVLAASKDHDLLIIADGTNDTDPMTQTLVNNQAMIDAELRLGGRVILTEIPPAGSQAVGSPADFTLVALPGYSGGTLPAGTYYYQITCRGTFGSSSPTVEKSVVLSATGAIQINWTPKGGATGYAIWGRATGNSKPLVWQNGPGTAQTTPQTQYIDLGAATTAATMPLVDATASTAPTSDVRTKIARVNAVKRHLSRVHGIPVIDQNALLADWTIAGNRYKPNYSGDSTHPTFKTQRLMGVNIASKIAALYPLPDPELCKDSLDPLSLLPPIAAGSNLGTTGGLLLANSASMGTGVRPWSWSWYGPGAATGSTSLDTDSTVVGNVYTINRTSWDAALSDLSITTGFMPGDLLYFAFKLKTTGLDAISGGVVAIGLKAIGSTGATYVSAVTLSVDAPTSDLPGGWAVWRTEARVPPGTTSLTAQFNVLGAGVSASIAQLTVRNLSAQGLVP